MSRVWEGARIAAAVIDPVAGDPSWRSEPYVRFYDKRHRFEDVPGSDGRLRGQFTGGEYLISTILEHEEGVGLRLMGDVPEWTVSGNEMTLVLEWLRAWARETGNGWSAR